MNPKLEKNTMPFVVIDAEKFQSLIDKVEALLQEREPMQPKSDGIFDVESVADYLQTSPQTIYKWVKAREIPYYKVGKFLRFRQSDIDMWFADKRKATAKESIRNK